MDLIKFLIAVAGIVLALIFAIWIATSILKIYAHLTDVDTEKVMAARAGIITPEIKEKSKILEPQQCPRCYAINRHDQEYCGKCGLPLSDSAVATVTGAQFNMAEQLKNPDVQKALAPVLAEILAKMNAKT